MFASARLKLTAWYLLIIMVISIAFSVGMYRVLTGELDRVERMQRYRQQRNFQEGVEIFPRRPILDPELVTETKNRIRAILILVNLGILAASSTAAYFLAGKTLKPIKEMVDEQNRFITDSSHELRTPLTSLKSEIEVGLRDKKLTLTEARKLLESNLEEVNNLQYLSDNLIKMTQYQTINDRVYFGQISTGDIISEALKKVSKLSKQKKIDIKNRVNNFSLNGDRNSLVELFVILLDNAIKYSDKNKTVILSVVKDIYSSPLAQNDKYIVIEVKDQGAGISKDEIPHLFDRFYRGDKSRAKSDTPGYGLGLSIAKQIVEKHRGKISVESIEGKGSTFTIQIPLKQSNKII